MAAPSDCLIYQVAVGETQPFWEPCIESVARYARRMGARHIVQRQPLLKIAPENSQRSENALRLGYLPIFEKENAFAYLQHFRQVMVIDADVFISATAPALRIADAAFAGVRERDLPCTPKYREKLRKHSEGQFRSLEDVDWDWQDGIAAFYNMGVMVLGQKLLHYLDGQTPSDFLRRPEFARFVNGEGHWRWSTDQTLLNWWLKRCGALCWPLDWRWNALYGAVQDVSEAYFVHFFLAAKMEHRGSEIPKIIEGL